MPMVVTRAQAHQGPHAAQEPGWLPGPRVPGVNSSKGDSRESKGWHEDLRPGMVISAGLLRSECLCGMGSGRMH